MRWNGWDPRLFRQVLLNHVPDGMTARIGIEGGGLITSLFEFCDCRSIYGHEMLSFVDEVSVVFRGAAR